MGCEADVDVTVVDNSRRILGADGKTCEYLRENLRLR